MGGDMKELEEHLAEMKKLGTELILKRSEECQFSLDDKQFTFNGRDAYSFGAGLMFAIKCLEIGLDKEF